MIIKRLYLENYKLFAQKEISFDRGLLSVFDGPNGYGKTSIFDALELIFTGKISRIKECDSISGNSTYDTVFFAQNSKKDVIIKLELYCTDSLTYVVIGAKVKSATLSGKNANPKNIFDSVVYYCLPQYDISIDAWEEFVLTKVQMEDFRKKTFGEQNVLQFTLFHYIRQEDRLAYFKQSEASRSTTIENILGVEEEREKYRLIKERTKSVDKAVKRIQEELDKKCALLVSQDTSIDDENQRYFQLLNGLEEWDREEVIFSPANAQQKLNQYIHVIEEIESLWKYRAVHSEYRLYKDFSKVPDEKKRLTIKALLIRNSIKYSAEELENLSQKLNFLTEQKSIVESKNYLDADIRKILLELDLEELCDDFEREKGSLVEIAKSQGNHQKALNSLLQLRTNLHLEHAKLGESSVCPYCGFDWKMNLALEDNYESTRTILESFVSEEGERYTNQVNVITNMFMENVYTLLCNEINRIKEIELVNVYRQMNSISQYSLYISQIEGLFQKAYFEIESELLKNEGDIDSQCAIIEEYCRSFVKRIPEDYLIAEEQYHFENLWKLHKITDEWIRQTQEGDFQRKRYYLQSQFYKSFDGLKNEITELESKKESLLQLQQQLKAYGGVLNNAIEIYKKQILDEIEIPFFVYSSRLLQSYQGGQGVLMENDGKTIRFVTPGGEHDVLYTMSSGQLSAVLLAFSLALNKKYAGDNMNMVLIDDPIQCMDDLNIVSFVELLRCEFGNRQIILSTHEEDFSNFIRYKFKKYGIETQSITLKEA